MKIRLFFIIAFLDILSIAKSQTFVMLDRRWIKTAQLTDSVTRNNLSDGWFPVYNAELDSLIILVDKLKNLKKDGLNRKFYYSEDFKTEHLEFIIENIKRAYGDGYEINLITKGPFGQNTLKLSDPRLTLPDNQSMIRSFLKYLQKTKKDLSKISKP
jgi:hypothetical protein